jgi:hypothetical protein
LTGNLSELSGATRLREIVVSHNERLKSLEGLPLDEIRHIHADKCGLTGNHTFLVGAANLRKLDLESNPKSLILDRAGFDSRVEVQV